ncbi:hypothetical protein Q4494_16625 [Celeribacter halophilus]|uniref:Uncharacterized protein n=1 Tax=Celeribacter halophilus TaxID=576117 RepID=A0AAW7XX85_9RHOB|nr:hypothetical protein [Celeribacter halophilus]MDO6458712.1 hypothetical protein [Celeribacter halophilus]
MIELFKSSIKSHGFIGDTKLPVLVYLTFITALFDKPVSLLVKGAASSGKSYALACAKRYVPEIAYKQFEGMSEKALVYMGGTQDLKHRTLIVQEAAGMASGDGRVFLRQLLTEGSIHYATVQQTKDGFVGTELPPVEGPCGLIMTTTASSIHHEDETRMLSFHMEESPEHFREILMRQASGYEGTTLTEEELKPFHDLYFFLREQKPEVEIPFLGEIAEALPPSHPRILRDFPKIVSLVKAVALLHVSERERGEDGQVIAQVKDYEIVRDLLNDVLSQGLSISVPSGVREVVECVEALTQGERDGSNFPFSNAVSQKEIARYLGLDPSVVSRHVFKAVQDEYLHDDNPGQGKKARLRLGEEKLPSGSVLPTLLT